MPIRLSFHRKSTNLSPPTHPISALPLNRVLAALEATADGELAVGDKSSPEDIWKILPGLSKAQYKAGIGALLRWRRE
jgi:predicted RNA-binding protein (virulence factor B family)